MQMQGALTRGTMGGTRAQKVYREARFVSESDRLLPDPAVLFVAPERIVEEDLAPLGDVDRLVRRLLAQLGDLVFLERAFEQLGEGLDRLLEIAA